jgi:hypothetical protein
LIARKIVTLFSPPVAAAAEVMHFKGIFPSLPNMFTCHLNKKLVKNNEKQGRYDQKCSKNQKSEKSNNFFNVQY